VVAALAVIFAGLVVLISLVVVVVNRRSVTTPEAPGLSKSATPTPTTIVNLAGTRWTDTYQSLAEKNYYFSPDGTINNNPGSTWKQNGNAVILEFNDHYARYEGTINGDRIDYKARNKANFEWTATILRSR